MAGGPIYPYSAIPTDTTGRLFPVRYAGVGGNIAPNDQALGVVGSLGADATWDLRFLMPPAAAIPSGTLKLRVLMLSAANSGVVKYTVNDAVVAVGSSPSAATLTAETQSSITWVAGDSDKYKEDKVTLTASPAGNDVLVVGLKFQTSGWTLSVTLACIVSVIWE